jgi:hypothetical protein
MQSINKNQFQKIKKPYVQKQFLSGQFPIYIKHEFWDGCYLLTVLNKHGAIKVERVILYPPEEEATMWQMPASGYMGVVSKIIEARMITQSQLNELKNEIISKIQYQKEIIMAKYGIDEMQ